MDRFGHAWAGSLSLLVRWRGMKELGAGFGVKGFSCERVGMLDESCLDRREGGLSLGTRGGRESQVGRVGGRVLLQGGCRDGCE